jgi:guanylate kinase
MLDRAPGLLVVISGPSGAGKGAVRRELQQCRDGLVYGVSCTTREPRPGEQPGEHYFFLSEEEFHRRIEEGELVEWAEVYGNYYGTPREPMESLLAEGTDVIVEKDTQGATTLMEEYPDAVYVFILPPSLDELQNRIEKRGTECEAVQETRLASAQEELAYLKCYDYVVVNDDIERAASCLGAIITAEKCRVSRCQHDISRFVSDRGGLENYDEPTGSR